MSAGEPLAAVAPIPLRKSPCGCTWRRSCKHGTRTGSRLPINAGMFLLKYSMCPAGSAETVLDLLPPLTIVKTDALEVMRLYDGEDPQRLHKSNIGRAD